MQRISLFIVTVLALGAMTVAPTVASGPVDAVVLADDVFVPPPEEQAAIATSAATATAPSIFTWSLASHRHRLETPSAGREA